MKSFSVAEGTTLYVTGNVTVSDLVINGKLAVGENGKVDASTKTVTVLGEIEIDEDNQNADAIKAANVYVGMTAKDVYDTGVASTITGTQITYDVLYVLNGAVID